MVAFRRGITEHDATPVDNQVMRPTLKESKEFPAFGLNGLGETETLLENKWIIGAHKRATISPGNTQSNAIQTAGFAVMSPGDHVAEVE